MVEYFNQIYFPENMILCVVGDADFDKLIAFVEKNFIVKEGKKQISIVKEKNISEIETRKGIDQANLIFGYHVPKDGEEKCYAAQFFQI
jgi:predicted Zn-dependent peptidase